MKNSTLYKWVEHVTSIIMYDQEVFLKDKQTLGEITHVLLTELETASCQANKAVEQDDIQADGVKCRDCGIRPVILGYDLCEECGL